MPPFGGNPGFIKSCRDQLTALTGDKQPWGRGVGWGPPSVSCWQPASVSWWAGGFGGISAELGWTVVFPTPARKGPVFPTFCFLRVEGKQSQLPELSLHPGWLSPAASIAPHPLIGFWFLRAATAALSQPGSCLEAERKGCCWQNGWFSEKKNVTCLSPGSKRGRMELLQSHLLLGEWSTAGGISEDTKCVCWWKCIRETCGSTLQSESDSRDPFQQLLKQIEGKLLDICCQSWWEMVETWECSSWTFSSFMCLLLLHFLNTWELKVIITIICI